MAHHLCLIADDDLPVIRDDDGAERAATEQEIINHGLFRVGTAPNGAGVYAIPCADPCKGHPGTIIASGFLQERHGRVPGGLAKHVLRARVYRATDGRVNLRRRLERDLRIEIPEREPRLGRRPDRRPDRDSSRSDAVLQEAQRLAALEIPEARALTVAMADVAPSDIVEDVDLYPLRIAGEISIR